MISSLEIIVALVAPTVAILLYLISLLIKITTRLTALETNMDLMLQWVACLNGEISDKTEYRKFLKKLKRVSREKFGDELCGK